MADSLYTYTLKNGATFKVRASSESAAKKKADSYAKEKKTSVSSKGSSSTSSGSSRTLTVPEPKKTSVGRRVIGQYNNVDIYEGDDRDIQEQMAEINKGRSSSSSRTRTDAPDVGGIYDDVIKSNPVLADMLKDPKAKARYDALSPDLQGIFLQTARSLGKAIESGKVVNPNIELTAKENRKLLQQAESELDPYYREQMSFLKDDFNTSVDRLMEDYGSATAREKDKFKRTLETQAGTEAEQGTAFSSGRVDRETQTVTEEQQALDDAAITATRTATDRAKDFEKKAGSSALRSLNLPSLSTFTATNRGINDGGSRTLYEGLGNVKLGSQEKERTTAVSQRKSELEQAFRANRILDLSKLR